MYQLISYKYINIEKYLNKAKCEYHIAKYRISYRAKKYRRFHIETENFIKHRLSDY